MNTNLITLLKYHVSYLVLFSVTCFVLALSILVGIGCLISDTMCVEAENSTMSQIVDQPEIYNWFSVLTTFNTILLFIAMYHYIDPIRLQSAKCHLSSLISSVALLFQACASILFLTVVLLPVSVHPESHVIVVKIAFAFVILVHICIWCRTYFCEIGRWHTVVVVLQTIHIMTENTLAIMYLLTGNGWIEIAFILTSILFYYFLAYEYWNVTVFCVLESSNTDLHRCTTRGEDLSKSLTKQRGKANAQHSREESKRRSKQIRVSKLLNIQLFE